jgi:tRNA dimethylallyltransferase
LPTAVALVGPTASGKAALGLEIAERFEQPILVCDSVKVYRGLDIGSAKPSPATRARVPHHLIDLCDPDEDFTAYDYAEAAWSAFHEHGGLFVGGTGLYLRATAWTTSSDTGRAGAPRTDPERADFEAQWAARDAADPGAAHRALVALDPATAATIHPHNRVRVVRALWLCHAHGGPVSAVRSAAPPQPRMRLLLLVLDPGPRVLSRRIEDRVDRMLAAGWVAEVERLCAAGYHAGHKAMRSLGYRQLLPVVRGHEGASHASLGAELARARDEIVVATRQYARRQRTYFRHQLPAEDVVHLGDPTGVPWERVRAFLGERAEVGSP